MPRMLLAFLLLFASMTPTPANPFGQKRILIVNATPYQILGFSVFDEQHHMITGSMDVREFVVVYVEEKSCVFELSAMTPQGYLFSRTLDACWEPSVWIIRTDIAI